MKRIIPVLLIIFFIAYWLFLIRPAIFGQLGGTFKPKEVPQDYLVLKDFLVSQKDFFRTLWLPTKQRFGFYSNLHPAVSAQDFMADDQCLAPFCDLKVKKYNREYFHCYPNEHCFPADFSFLANPKTPEILSQLSIKYIIIAYDSETEIFFRERKYDQEAWTKLIGFVDSLGTYKPIKLSGRVKVYQVPIKPKDHFFIPRLTGLKANALVSYKMVNPTKYMVKIKNANEPFTLVFSEKYNRFWQAHLAARQAKTDRQTISSQKYLDILNSFKINKTGNFSLIIEYSLQKYVYWGLLVSGATLLVVVYYLLKSRRV